MKRKSQALFVTLLLLIGVILVFLGTTPDLKTTPARTSESASADSALRPSPEPDLTSPPDAETARRISPLGWSPPAVFAVAGAPVRQKQYPRGENASRQYHAPETHDLPRNLRIRTPAVLAKTPEDGRLHLLPEEIDLHTRIARRMVFDPASLDHIIAGNASRLLIPTTGDEVLTLEFHAVKTRSAQSHTLLGRILGEEETSDVLVVYHDGVIHGAVARYTTEQHLEYRILADGHMMVRELDPGTMTAACGNGPETTAEELFDETSDDGFEIIPRDDGEVSGDTAGWRTIDVVVGYDQGARIADGGYSQIEARIIASVDRMSTAFANSLITNTEIMLLGTIEDPVYVFPGSDSGSQSGELSNLNNFTNGALDTVSNYSTLLGADLVSFVQKQADGSAGLAYLPGRASIVARDYMTSNRITFAHELGHNLGCDHSWGDSSQNYHSRYGWRLETPNKIKARTIMAYDWGWGTRIPYFSNPSVSFNGAATGAVNGYNVQGDATADQRYYQGGLGYSGSDPLKFGFNGVNSTLGSNNANTIDTGAGSSSYGATYASNRATRASFAVTSPIAGAELSRGSSQSIFFRGGDMQDLATIQLFKGGVFQSTLATNLNPATRRNFSWSIPTNLLAGPDYMIRVTLNHPGGGTSTADSGVFTILGSAPRILTHAPAATPTVTGPVSQVSLTFDQAMNPATFSTGEDIVSFTGPQGLTLTPAITGATWSDGNSVLTIQFPAQSLPGYYRMVIGPGIASPDGYLLDQNLNDILGEAINDRYVASFQISTGGASETLWSDMVGTDAPDAGWSFSGTGSSWQTGTPTSNPNTTFDGGPIIAQNLAGNYNVSENSFAQSPVINCGSHNNITLSFRGWKGAGKNDTLYIDAWSGSSWQRVYNYTGPNSGANDTSWTLYQPALGSHGDLNADFKLRWGLVDVTNANSGVQTGWQIDSIVVQGSTDNTPPAAWVTSHFPQGMVEDFQSSVWLEFSQPMDTGSFAPGDIASFTGPSGLLTATGFQWLHPTLLRIDFPPQSALGQYALTLAPTVLDQAGRPLDQDFDETPGEAGDDTYIATFQIGSTAGPVDRFVISGLPASVEYGTTITGITITARDVSNKIAATFTGPVTFSGTAGITGTSSNFVDGVLENVNITPTAIGNGLTLVVDDGAGHTGVGSFHVTRIPATITFINATLSQTYDGTERTVYATTNPSGLGYVINYEGDPAVPVNAGGYEVTATITAPAYQGSASGILIVDKASQTINFAPPGTVGNDLAQLSLTASATSGLPVSYTSSNPAVATVSGSTLTIIGDGTTTITASQAGNINYNPAASVQQELTVLRVQPIANPGGPYKVLVGESLALDGRASLPSDGESITTHEWDLNNDNVFGDATGPTPSAIDLDTLKNTWVMTQGLNTIQLKVTDSAGKSSIASTTVELVLALTWDANGTATNQTNGGGAWLGNNLWWDGAANRNWASGSNAIFGGPNTAGGAVTLAGPTSANTITFNTFTGTYTLGTAGQTLTINDGINKTASSAAVSIISPVTLGGDQIWTNNSSGLLTVSGAVGGSGGFTKSGSGTLILNAAQDANNYTGNTKVAGGILQIGTGWQTSNNIPGGLTGTSGTAASNLEINGGTVSIYYYMTRVLGTGASQIRITGGRSGFTNKQGDATTRNWRIGDNAAYEIVWGGDHFKPTTLVLQDAAASPGSATFTLDNKIDLNGATRTVEVGASIATLPQIIRNSSGTAGLIKTGNGQLILSANNTYNGTTTVSAGFLDFGAIALSGFGGGSGRNISVSAGAIVRRNTLDNTFLNRLVETSDEITVMTGTTANNLDFSSSTGAALPNVWLGNWTTIGAKAEYSGTFIFGGDNYRLGTPASSGLLGIVGNNKLTGPQGLIVGGSRVELASPNNFSGDTFIRDGARLYLGNNLALQNSALDTGTISNTGTFGLSDGTNSGRIAGGTASPSPTFGGLKGSRNLLSAYNGTNAGNNATLLASTAVTGFTLNPGTGKSYTYSGAIADFATGTTLTKTGPGMQILAGNNIHTGDTNLNAGKLFINGSLSNVNAALTVAANATLGGNGTIGRNVTIEAGGKLEFDISTAAAGHDRLDISSGRSFAFSGSSEITITSNGGAEPGTYTLITGGNNITGPAPATVNLPEDWVATVSISGNSLLLNVTSVVGGPGPVDHFVISPIGSPQTVGTPVTGITITALDASNETATDFSGTVTFAGTGGFSGTSANFVNGMLTNVGVTPTVAGGDLTLTVDDGSGHVGSTTISVIQTIFENWAGVQGLTGDAALPNANPDGDSLTNLQEFAFGTNPTASTNGPIAYVPGEAVTSPGLPVTLNLSNGEGVDFRVVFGRRKDHQAAGLNYTVRFSAGLDVWVNGTASPTILTGENNPGDIEAVSVPYPLFIPVADGFRKPILFRVDVSSN